MGSYGIRFNVTLLAESRIRHLRSQCISEYFISKLESLDEKI